MSTEPGWMAERREFPLLLGERERPQPQNDPSMLLSFERPASARSSCEAIEDRLHQSEYRAWRYRLSTVLENCTEATSAAIDKRRLITGITGPYKMEILRKEYQVMLGQITVKIVRAHGGCLGTKSR